MTPDGLGIARSYVDLLYCLIQRASQHQTCSAIFHLSSIDSLTEHAVHEAMPSPRDLKDPTKGITLDGNLLIERKVIPSYAIRIDETPWADEPSALVLFIFILLLWRCGVETHAMEAQGAS